MFSQEHSETQSNNKGGKREVGRKTLSGKKPVKKLNKH